MSAITLKIDERNIATLTLNRPVIHNAFDDLLVREVTDQLRELEKNAALRALVLASTGPSFSAGADLQWMRRMSTASIEVNQRDAEALRHPNERHPAQRLPGIAALVARRAAAADQPFAFVEVQSRDGHAAAVGHLAGSQLVRVHDT